MLKKLLLATLLAVCAIAPFAPSASAAPSSATGLIYAGINPDAQGACATLTTNAGSYVVGSFTVTAIAGGVSVTVSMTVPSQAGSSYVLYQNCVGRAGNGGFADAVGHISETFILTSDRNYFTNVWEFDGNIGDSEHFRSEPVTVVPGASGPVLPTNASECKKDGWRAFSVFKNQGDCVSFVATGGRNAPAL